MSHAHTRVCKGCGYTRSDKRSFTKVSDLCHVCWNALQGDSHRVQIGSGSWKTIHDVPLTWSNLKYEEWRDKFTAHCKADWIPEKFVDDKKAADAKEEEEAKQRAQEEEEDAKVAAAEAAAKWAAQAKAMEKKNADEDDDAEEDNDDKGDDPDVMEEETAATEDDPDVMEEDAAAEDDDAGEEEGDEEEVDYAKEQKKWREHQRKKGLASLEALLTQKRRVSEKAVVNDSRKKLFEIACRLVAETVILRGMKCEYRVHCKKWFSYWWKRYSSSSWFPLWN